jgi:hypothetical protein
MKAACWVVYKMTVNGKLAGPNAVCEQAEWDEMQRQDPAATSSSGPGWSARERPSGWPGRRPAAPRPGRPPSSSPADAARAAGEAGVLRRAEKPGCPEPAVS